MNRLSQDDANRIVSDFLRNTCFIDKRKIYKRVMLSKNQVSQALRYLRKKGIVGIYISGKAETRKIYWGWLYD